MYFRRGRDGDPIGARDVDCEGEEHGRHRGKLGAVEGHTEQGERMDGHGMGIGGSMRTEISGIEPMRKPLSPKMNLRRRKRCSRHDVGLARCYTRRE